MTCYVVNVGWSKPAVFAGRALLALVAISSAACLSEGGPGACDPGFVPDGDLCVEATAQLDVIWDPDPDCPEGATTAQVVSIDTTGTEYLDIYWCDDYGGITGPLPLDTYQVYVNLTDTREVELFARSRSQDVVLTRADGITELDFAFPADVAFLEASWSVSGGCDSVGAATVELVREPAEILASADCQGGHLETSPLPLGSYSVFARTVADDGTTVIGASPVVEVELEYGNQLADAGAFEL